MMLLFCLMLVQGPSWTWYEHYEQGVKHYQAQRYQACLDSMDSALRKKPEPKRNQFTRAVQKIDYAPFYYRALCYYALNDLSAANAAAQRAFRGEVVAQSAKMQADLTPIFEAYRNQAAELRAEIENERRLLKMRTRFLQLIQTDQLETFEREITELEKQGADAGAFDDIRAIVQMRADVAQKDARLRNDLSQRIASLLDAGFFSAAEALFNEYRDQIPADKQTVFENALQAHHAVLQKDQANRDAAAERDAELEASTQALLAEYEKQRDALEAERSQLANQLASSEDKNRALQDELQRERTEGEPLAAPAEFTGVLLLRPSGLKQMVVEARFLGASAVNDWLLQVNGREQAVTLTPLASDNPLQHRWLGTLDVDRFGDFEVRLTLDDDLGRRLELTEALRLERPWYLYTQIYLLLAVIVVIVVLARQIRVTRRRKLARLRHFNPYIAGSPVRRPEMFFGRESLMQRIQGSLHKNSFMIHGDRRIGKTSFLLQLKSNLEQLDPPEYRFYPVFIDLQGLHEGDLFHHLMAEVCNAAADWSVEHEDLEVHQRHEGYLARHLAKDIKRLIQRLKEGESRHVLIVLLMDEVDVLNEFSDKTNQKLRSIFMKEFAEHLSCIMAGIHLKKEWESSGSPWYNFFEEVPVISLDESAARELILDPVEGIFTYEPAAVTALLKATSGHPYLIQKLCIKLVDQKLQSGLFHIRLGDVEQLLQEKHEEARA